MPHGAKQYEGEQITMLTFDDSYFLGETRDGFYIEPMMKCAWAAQLEVMCVIKQICENMIFLILHITELYWVPSGTRALSPGMMIWISVCFVKTTNVF